MALQNQERDADKGLNIVPAQSVAFDKQHSALHIKFSLTWKKNVADNGPY